VPRLARADLDSIASISRELGTWVENEPHALGRCISGMRDVLGAHKTLAYGIEAVADGFGLVFCDWADARGSQLLPSAPELAFRSYLAAPPAASHGGLGAAFNPHRPEAWQRNRVVDWEELEQRFVRPPPMVKVVFPRFGVRLESQVRVLVCEGPSLLGWVGGFWDGLATLRQKRIFQRLVPALQRRLMLERSLRTAPSLRVALDAALEAIGAPAFIITEGGSVAHVNSAGRRLLAIKHASTKAELREAGQYGKSAQFTLTRIAQAGAATQYLAVSTSSPNTELRVRAAARRWELSARQAEVLAWLVQGSSNARIGAELGISDRTVESHVASILDKAQVGSRAALVSAIMT